MLPKVLDELVAAQREIAARDGKRLVVSDDELAARLMTYYAKCPICRDPIDFEPLLAVGLCKNRAHFITFYGLALAMSGNSMRMTNLNRSKKISKPKPGDRPLSPRIVVYTICSIFGAERSAYGVRGGQIEFASTSCCVGRLVIPDVAPERINANGR
jgi:hypothetical protein